MTAESVTIRATASGPSFHLSLSWSGRKRGVQKKRRHNWGLVGTFLMMVASSGSTAGAVIISSGVSKNLEKFPLKLSGNKTLISHVLRQANRVYPGHLPPPPDLHPLPIYCAKTLSSFSRNDERDRRCGCDTVGVPFRPVFRLLTVRTLPGGILQRSCQHFLTALKILLSVMGNL